MRRMRRVKILATLGPASQDRAVLAQLFEAGADLFRINMSHASHAAMRERMAALNPGAAARIAERLLEANDRGYWAPNAETLDALRDAAAELEDRMEGVGA